MKRLIRLIVAIAFGIILLELMVLSQKHNWFEFTTMRIMSLASLAALLYIFIFERKQKSK